MVDKEKVKESYLEWVNKVSDDLEDKTQFTIDEIIDKVTELVLKEISASKPFMSIGRTCEFTGEVCECYCEDKCSKDHD